MIYESFIESNERLRQKFFPDIAVVFPPSTEVAEPDYLIAEDDFETIVDVLEIIRKHGKGVISNQEYTRVCTAIFSSIDDVMKVGSVTSDVPAEVSTEVGTEVVLSDKDAILLGKAARHFEM